MTGQERASRFMKEWHALFRYGPEKKLGERHVMWDRLGNHGIYKQR